jgi:apolipoprotein N-acyltransferase
VAAAFALRGGAAMTLAGVALVRADGRPATRRQCAWRAFLVWLPITLLLAAAVWVQVTAPHRVLLPTVLILAAVALLPVYVVVAMAYPDRPPQDRLAGTYLVPA